MADDIVVRLRTAHLGRDIRTHYDGCVDAHPLCALTWALDTIELLTEWRQNALLALDKREAEIARLRAREQDLRMHAEQDACEIERLRAAGDALHDAIRSHNLTEAHLKAWHEARRG